MVLSPLSADCVSRESAPLFLSSPQKLLFSFPPLPSPPPASDNLSRRKRRGLMECGGGGKSNPHMGFLSLASHGSFFKTLPKSSQNNSDDWRKGGILCIFHVWIFWPEGVATLCQCSCREGGRSESGGDSSDRFPGLWRPSS